MVILDGRAVADKMAEELKQRVEVLKEKGRTPVLHVFSDTTVPENVIYTRQKKKRAEEIGIVYKETDISKLTQFEAYRALIGAQDDDGESIILQHPVRCYGAESRKFEQDLQYEIDDDLGADGESIYSLGEIMMGSSGEISMVPCTARGIIDLLKAYKVPLEGKNAVVIGRSVTVGKATAMLLLDENCTVTICHSKTPMAELMRNTIRADILVSAAGKPWLVTPEMVKDGAAIVDVGITRTEEGIRGDVWFDGCKRKAGWITPVPGGVGPMTVIELMRNVVEAAEKHA